MGAYPAGSGVKAMSLWDMELSGISMDIRGYSSVQALGSHLEYKRFIKAQKAQWIKRDIIKQGIRLGTQSSCLQPGEVLLHDHFAQTEPSESTDEKLPIPTTIW